MASGITAGDLAMQRAAQGEAPKEPESVQVPEAPKEPQPQTPFDVIMLRFDDLNKRLDQQGTAIVEIGNRVLGSGPAQPVASSGAIGISLIPDLPPGIKDLLAVVKNSLGVGGSDPMKEYFSSIGKTVFDKTLESTMKRVSGGLAGETARHVIG